MKLSGTVDNILVEDQKTLNCFSCWPCTLNVTWKIFYYNGDATIEDTSID